MDINNIQSLKELSKLEDYDPRSLPVKQAREYILKFLAPVKQTERIPIIESLGRVTSSDILSPINVPPHNNSAMDGYAVKASDLNSNMETRLKVVGKAFAGKPFFGDLAPREAVRIMTGAVVPQNLDTVVMQENVELQKEEIIINNRIAKGTNTRNAGEDLQKGKIAIGKGKLIRPGDMGLLASLGIPTVEVFRKVKVVFFSTGDELVGVGEKLGIGEIYDSNRYTLRGLLDRLGCDITDMGVIKDEKKTVENALLEASASADVIITTGGVSVGEADYIKEILDKLGQVLFWKIAMKPGRPLAYGKINDCHFFGLPGNPVSVVVTFYQFVQNALKILQGENQAKMQPIQKIKSGERIRKIPGRTEYQRGIISFENGEWMVKTTGDQGSGILSSVSQADCFIILDATEETIEPGHYVNVQVLEGLV